MRILWAALWISTLATAQQQPKALVRGVLLERDPQTATGEFSVRDPDNQVFRYRFDGNTYVERDSRMVEMARLVPGDRIEVLSDAVAGSRLRYALTVHVMPPPAPTRPQSAGRYRASAGFEERRIPAGSLGIPGVVARISPASLTLHTRTGDQVILLRPDTRYLEGGVAVDASLLKANMRVFVQAGKTLYEEIEAYQVVWGGILRP